MNSNMYVCMFVCMYFGNVLKSYHCSIRQSEIIVRVAVKVSTQTTSPAGERWAEEHPSKMGSIVSDSQPELRLNDLIMRRRKKDILVWKYFGRVETSLDCGAHGARSDTHHGINYIPGKTLSSLVNFPKRLPLCMTLNPKSVSMIWSFRRNKRSLKCRGVFGPVETSLDCEAHGARSDTYRGTNYVIWKEIIFFSETF